MSIPLVIYYYCCISIHFIHFSSSLRCSVFSCIFFSSIFFIIHFFPHSSLSYVNPFVTYLLLFCCHSPYSLLTFPPSLYLSCLFSSFIFFVTFFFTFMHFLRPLNSLFITVLFSFTYSLLRFLLSPCLSCKFLSFISFVSFFHFYTSYFLHSIPSLSIITVLFLFTYSLFPLPSICLVLSCLFSSFISFIAVFFFHSIPTLIQYVIYYCSVFIRIIPFLTSLCHLVNSLHSFPSSLSFSSTLIRSLLTFFYHTFPFHHNSLL